VRLPPTPRAPRLSRSGLICVLYGGLLLLALGWGAVRGRPDVLRMPGRTAPTEPLIGLALGTGFALVVVFLSRWATHRLQWARVLHQEFRHLLGELGAREVLLLAAASAVGEETFFRGAMLPDLGLWLSSALFALPHIGPGARFLPWTATSFVVGLALGGMFIYTGDLAGPIAAHFLINLINLNHITRERA
jgi:membrane protease YdiL (CAAX protease family)